MTRSDTEVSPI